MISEVCHVKETKGEGGDKDIKHLAVQRSMSSFIKGYVQMV